MDDKRKGGYSCCVLRLGHAKPHGLSHQGVVNVNIGSHSPFSECVIFSYLCVWRKLLVSAAEPHFSSLFSRTAITDTQSQSRNNSPTVQHRKLRPSPETDPSSAAKHLRRLFDKRTTVHT